MGRIELTNGLSTRRIRVEELPGVVRIDVSGADPRVIVPENVAVSYRSADGRNPDPGATRPRR